MFSKFQENLSGNFYHYTTIDSARIICENNSLRLSRVDKVNDKKEIPYHPNKERTYELCFCCSQSERIAMWYIYAGAYYGCRLKLTQERFKKIFENLDKVYLSDADLKNDKNPLIKDKDFKIKADYCSYLFDKGYYYNRTLIKNGVVEDTDFKKDKYWKYENEFRIVITLNENHNTDSIYIKTEDKCFSMLLSPEVPKELCKEIENEFVYEKKLIKEKQFKLSKLLIESNILDRYIKSYIYSGIKIKKELLDTLKEHINMEVGKNEN